MSDYSAYIWILWDLAAVLTLAWFIWHSAVRGLIRTLVSLIGYVAAAAVARVVSPVLATLVYDNVVRDALRVVLMGRLDELLAQGGAVLEDVVDQIPGTLMRIIDSDLLESAGLSQAAGTLIDAESARLVESIIDAALREPVLSMLQGLFFLLVFTLASLVVRHISRLFHGVYKIPVVGAVNTALGGVIGVLQACLALVVAALCLQLLFLFTGGGFTWANPQIMEDTYVFRVFYNLFSL